MSAVEIAPEAEVIEHRVVGLPFTLQHRIGFGAFLVVVGAIVVRAFGFAVASGADAHLKLGDANAHVHDLVFAARWVIVLLGVAIIALGVWHIARGFPRARFNLALGGAVLLFMIAFLSWVSVHSAHLGPLDVVGLLQNTIGLSVPLILGALAGVMCERSGVINVAIEGEMLAGAWAGALFGSLMGLWMGLVGAAIFGALVGLILAVFAIRYLVNQVVLGVVLNVFALGLTGFFYDAYMQPHTNALNSPGVFHQLNVPGLDKIWVIGPVLFEANAVVYLTYALIIVVDVALFRTRWGLRTRAVGEHPKAADTVGINVLRTRYRNVLLGSAIAGLGGAYMTIGSVGGFGKDITSGNGFIALAAVIFGRWNPRGAVAAALLFGFATALQNTLSIDVPGIPSNFLAMLPYLATIFAVAGLVGRVRPPAADGEPYVKG